MAARLAVRALSVVLCAALASAFTSAPIFTAYVDPSPSCFRQPSLVVATGVLYAFVEGRTTAWCSGTTDGSNSSILVRSSSDGGETWGPVTFLLTGGGGAHPNPDYLLGAHDPASDTTLIFIQVGASVLLGRTTDRGATWSTPAPLTVVPPPGMKYAVNGVGHGIVVTGASGLCGEPTCGGASGRLLVPFVCYSPNPLEGGGGGPVGPVGPGDVKCPGCYSCLLASDDGGSSWGPITAVTNQDGSREASLVQLDAAAHGGGGGAVVYASERNMGNATGDRWHATSVDSGATFTSFGFDTSLPVRGRGGAPRSGSHRAIHNPTPPPGRGHVQLDGVRERRVPV